MKSTVTLFPSYKLTALPGTAAKRKRHPIVPRNASIMTWIRFPAAPSIGRRLIRKSALAPATRIRVSSALLLGRAIAKPLLQARQHKHCALQEREQPTRNEISEEAAELERAEDGGGRGRVLYHLHINEIELHPVENALAYRIYPEVGKAQQPHLPSGNITA
eukprot:scaffold3815_cov355-Prasinococcus_capsulatus_cf.AAC.4